MRLRSGNTMHNNLRYTIEYLSEEMRMPTLGRAVSATKTIQRSQLEAQRQKSSFCSPDHMLSEKQQQRNTHSTSSPGQVRSNHTLHCLFTPPSKKQPYTRLPLHPAGSCRVVDRDQSIPLLGRERLIIVRVVKPELLHLLYSGTSY